ETAATPMQPQTRWRMSEPCRASAPSAWPTSLTNLLTIAAPAIVTGGNRTMKAIVINRSAKHYNLGQAKLADWLKSQGYAVEVHSGDPGLFAYGFDLVCLSVIFSWDAPT